MNEPPRAFQRKYLVGDNLYGVTRLVLSARYRISGLHMTTIVEFQRLPAYLHVTIIVSGKGRYSHKCFFFVSGVD